MSNVAIFGGSFNPPHVGHALVALYVLQTAAVDEVWWVPAWRHAFDKPLVEFEHRYEMSLLAAAPLGEAVRVLRTEAEIGGESRTVVTLRALKEKHRGVSFRLVLGSDLIAECPRWLGWSEIERLAPPLYVARAGHPATETAGLPAMPEIASSDLRERLSRGADLAGWVSRPVLSYIRERGLYRMATQ